MISTSLADFVLVTSLLVSVGAYIFVSRHEGTYINILSPAVIVGIPAYYLLPWFYLHVFGSEASSYAFIYVYASVTTSTLLFAYAYTRRGVKLLRLPFHYGYGNFDFLALVSLAVSAVMYAPILLQFPEYLLSPRQIYEHTRTGFGINFFISSTFAYVAAILILFDQKSGWLKSFVILAAAVLLALHGSKGQVLTFFLLVLLFSVYVKDRKLKLGQSLLVATGVGLFGLVLFAAAVPLGETPAEIVEGISQYSDYTRNAMLVIDSQYPLQYGRLTLENAIIGRIPRALMPNKPKDFGAFQLADHFYPEAMDLDQGAPDFGIGVQYADFGPLAIVYLGAFALLSGWLARVFVERLNRFHHPADFVLFMFMGGVSVFSVGGIGWLLPEALVLAVLLRFASTLGAKKVFQEKIACKPRAEVATR